MDGFTHLLTLTMQDHLASLYVFGKITFILSTTITLSLLALAFLLALSNGLFSKSGLVVAPSVQKFTAGLNRRRVIMRRETVTAPLPTLTDLMAGESDADHFYYIDDDGEIHTYNRT